MSCTLSRGIEKTDLDKFHRTLSWLSLCVAVPFHFRGSLCTAIHTCNVVSFAKRDGVAVWFLTEKKSSSPLTHLLYTSIILIQQKQSLPSPSEDLTTCYLLSARIFLGIARLHGRATGNQRNTHRQVPYARYPTASTDDYTPRCNRRVYTRVNFVAIL